MPKGIRNKKDAAPFIDGLTNSTPDTSVVIVPAIQPPIGNDPTASGAVSPEVIAVYVPKAPAEDLPTIALTNHKPDMSRVFVSDGNGKMFEPKSPIEDLAAYAKRIERAAQPLAVCIITHPDAVDGAIFEGVYAGIRLVSGPEMSARLSDGNTI